MLNALRVMFYECGKEKMAIPLFILGAAIGSFLNVCIDRLPRHESLVMPASHCRSCRRQLRWYDLLPILSFIWRQGRCRYCHARIPAHHLLVEILTPLFFVLFWQRYDFSWHFVAAATMGSLLLIIAFIDWNWLIIPNSLVLLGLVIAFVEQFIFARANDVMPWLGSSIGAAILWLPGRVSRALNGRESIGAGDIKLAAMLGLYFGWQGVLIVIWLACLIGALYGLIGIKIGRLQRTSKIPLGFFMGLVGAGYLLNQPMAVIEFNH